MKYNQIKNIVYSIVFGADILYLIMLFVVNDSQWLKFRSSIGYFLMTISIILPMCMIFLKNKIKRKK